MSTREDDGLLACPFCGGIGHPYERSVGTSEGVTEGIVECGTCGCEMHGLDKSDAITDWNTRAAQKEG